jgi:hypothetical protein
MCSEPNEDAHGKIRPLLIRFDEAIMEYEKVVRNLLAACDKCRDKAWVRHVLEYRSIQHKTLGHALEESKKKAQ